MSIVCPRETGPEEEKLTIKADWFRPDDPKAGQMSNVPFVPDAPYASEFYLRSNYGWMVGGCFGHSREEVKRMTEDLLTDLMTAE